MRDGRRVTLGRNEKMMKNWLAAGTVALTVGMPSTIAQAQTTTVPGEQVGLEVMVPLIATRAEFELVKARIDAINQRGGSAFHEYQIPLATLALLQGLGRLIRTRLPALVLRRRPPVRTAQAPRAQRPTTVWARGT